MTAILTALMLALACLQPVPAAAQPDESSALIAASEQQAGNRVQWPAQELGEPTGDQLEGSEAP